MNNTNSYQLYKTCQVCGKSKIYNEHPLCISCAKKKNHYLKGKKMPIKTRKKISKTVRKSLQTHHIDLNIENNKKSNLLKLTIKHHRYLHLWAYKYLVDTGQIKKYIKWFFKLLKTKENSKIQNDKIEIKIVELQHKIKELEKSII
jgi:hypothetical protein